MHSFFRVAFVLPALASILSAAAAAQEALPAIEVIAAAPGGAEIARDKAPSNSVSVPAVELSRAQNSGVADALARTSPSVIIQQGEGNPFQPDVQFRGFAASPTPGTPQGLAVYQNGVRINEVFGDVVNWDFIPASAIANAQIVTANPVFGLNALGGALTLEMKNGFTFQGFELDLRFGSSARRQSALQLGRQSGAWSTYLALEGIGDNGWRDKATARVLRRRPVCNCCSTTRRGTFPRAISCSTCARARSSSTEATCPRPSTSMRRCSMSPRS